MVSIFYVKWCIRQLCSSSIILFLTLAWHITTQHTNIYLSIYPLIKITIALLRKNLEALAPYYEEGSDLRKQTLHKLTTAYWMELIHKKYEEGMQKEVKAEAEAAELEKEKENEKENEKDKETLKTRRAKAKLRTRKLRTRQ